MQHIRPCNIEGHGSRDFTSVIVTPEQIISRPCFLYEKCLVFHALSNGILCFGIWGDQIFTDRIAGGGEWGSAPDPLGLQQKNYSAVFPSLGIHNSVSKIKFKLTRRFNKLQ